MIVEGDYKDGVVDRIDETEGDQYYDDDDDDDEDYEVSPIVQ